MQKRLSCLLLSLLLLLTACSAPKAPAQDPAPSAAPEESTQTPAPPQPEPGATQLLRFDTDKDGTIVSMDLMADEAVICVNPPYSATGSARLYFLDLKTGLLCEPVTLEGTPEPELDQIAYTENGALLLYSPYADHAVLYDREGKRLDTLPQTVGASQHFWTTLADDSFNYVGNCGCDTLYTGYDKVQTLFAFADDAAALYFADTTHEQFLAAEGKRVLQSDSNEGGDSCTLWCEDLDAGQLLATATLRSDLEQGWLYPTAGLLFDGGALIQVIESRVDAEDYSQFHSVYLWYFDEPIGTPVAVRRQSYHELEAENERLIAEIAQDYEIEVLADVVPGSEFPEEDRSWRDSYGAITGCSPLEIYRFLRHLECFLQTLPEGFTHEMFRDLPGRWSDFEKFTIYIVSEIPGFPAAYAFHGGPEDFYLCFATREFSYSHLPHEFMHVMEARIHAYWESQYRSFWDAWDALNPPDCYGEDLPLDEEHFISSYAMTNSQEDRAVTFQQIYTASDPLAENWWYSEYPAVAAKVDFLLAAIREAYPSVQDAEEVFWEK